MPAFLHIVVKGLQFVLSSIIQYSVKHQKYFKYIC